MGCGVRHFAVPLVPVIWRAKSPKDNVYVRKPFKGKVKEAGIESAMKGFVHQFTRLSSNHLANSAHKRTITIRKTLKVHTHHKKYKKKKNRETQGLSSRLMKKKYNVLLPGLVLGKYNARTAHSVFQEQRLDCVTNDEEEKLTARHGT